MRKFALPLVALLTSCAAHTGSNLGEIDVCRLEKADKAWLDRSVRGWTSTRERVLEAPVPPSQDAVVFSSDCELRSSVAMLTGESRWTASPITTGKIQVGQQEIPVGVVSATIGDDNGVRFVMSTPSVWSAARVPPGELGIEKLMSAVFVHEATHVFQMRTYGEAIDRLQKEYRLSDENFNDDAIQERFKTVPDFSGSVSEEVRLFFAAASAADDNEALQLARRARALMRARAERYYVGNQAYQHRAEDLWLTLEGSAQWAGLRWLMLPAAQNGGGVSPEAAMSGFGRRGSSWTQLLGLGMFLTIDRLAAPSWKREIFGTGDKTALELLDEALAGSPS